MTDGSPQAMRAAAAVYRLAARTFAAEVDPPFYRALVDMCRAPGQIGFLPIDPPLRAMPEPNALDTLAVEYCRLFIGPRPVCPPYASARGLPARQAVRALIDAHGVKLRLPPRAPIADDDHAAIALALLAELCTGSAAAAYARFRDAHLLPWLPGFLTDVARHSRCGPYRLVASVTAALLRSP